ncbi:HSP20-like chaperone [Mariannaea sp. PMI_226]|nr:HSP20-like chaperone [Mariannaea sp. PMI_226]
MAFFPRQFYNSDASFTPLFRLLDDFDSYSRQGTRNVPQWQPKFDVRETEQGYELHGEFPGVKKEDVHIEFTEPQTILIRGKTERSYTSVTPPAAPVETKAADATSEGSDTASYQATVEDEYEAVESEEVTKEVEHPDPKEVVPEEPVRQSRPVDKAKYWLTERSVGEFSRSFNFPNRVEQDSVTASFKDGILTIIVPKAKKHESRRIAVN